MKASAVVVTVAPFIGVAALVGMGGVGHWSGSSLAGLALAVPSLLAITVARLQLGDSFSVAPRATALVTHGLYARVRNPIYIFGISFLTGVILLLGQPRFLVLVPFLAYAQYVRAGREARALEARFGDEYRRYCAQTWL